MSASLSDMPDDKIEIPDAKAGPLAWTQWLIALIADTFKGAETPREDPRENGPADPDSDVALEHAIADAVIVEAPAVKLYPVVDVTKVASLVRYPDRKHKTTGKVIRVGAVKRTKYAPVDLSKRRILIGLHQTGVNRSEANVRAAKITAHRVIGPTGVRYRVHPITVRLDAINRFNRDPWQTVNIEISGNFERVDGKGNWYKPDILGRGRMSEAQVLACRQEIAAIVDEVEALGFEVEGIVPHCVAGQEDGKPNRHACPGSRAWSECGEWAAQEFGLAVPAPGWSIGGVPIDPDWHGRYFDVHGRTLAA